MSWLFILNQFHYNNIKIVYLLLAVDFIEDFAISKGIYTTLLSTRIVPFDLFWFLQYGPIIMMATILDLFLMPLIDYIYSKVVKYLQKISILKQKLHKGLLDVLKSNKFAMGKILPNLISFMLTSLALLPGMPLMIPCLFLLFLFQFLTLKHLLVTNSSLPTVSHKNTLIILLQAVPLGLMISLIAGIMVYSNFYNSHIEAFSTCNASGYCDNIEFLVSLLYSY